MPSQAFKDFRYNLVDTRRLVTVHGLLSGGNPGKKGLGHLTRSGVVMLCASWELYVESLLVEAVHWLTSQHADPSTLPKAVKKTLASYVRNHKHHLMPLSLAGAGWKHLLEAYALTSAIFSSSMTRQ